MAEERRETERAVQHWQRRIEQCGFPPLKSTDQEFDDLIADDGANRFVIDVDETADEHVLLTYGQEFAHLVGLHERGGSRVRLLREIPEQVLPLFIDGIRSVAANQSLARAEGELYLKVGSRQLYRAVFMPVGRNLVLGAFTCCLSAGIRRSRGSMGTIERDVHSEEAAIAAFIRLRGITRCPTAYAVPTRGSITSAERAALERHVADLERQRTRRTRVAWNASFWALAASSDK